jgi:hypothetical protein
MARPISGWSEIRGTMLRKRMKTLKVTLAIAALAPLLAGCYGGYVSLGYTSPYYGTWGPYGGGPLIVGGYGYHPYYGWHHFYGHTYAVHHFAVHHYY